jgi:hypothetical protein
MEGRLKRESINKQMTNYMKYIKKREKKGVETKNV